VQVLQFQLRTGSWLREHGRVFGIWSLGPVNIQGRSLLRYRGRRSDRMEVIRSYDSAGKRYQSWEGKAGAHIICLGLHTQFGDLRELMGSMEPRHKGIFDSLRRQLYLLTDKVLLVSAIEEPPFYDIRSRYPKVFVHASERHFMPN